MPASIAVTNAEKWLRRAIPRTRLETPVLRRICRVLSEKLGGDAAVELRSAARRHGGRLEFVRLIESKSAIPQGMFILRGEKRITAYNSAGRTLFPEAVKIKGGHYMWFLEKENMYLSLAGLDLRTGELIDEGGCAIRSIWGAIHNGAKEYSKIRRSLSMIENLRTRNRRRDIGTAGVYSSTIDKYIGRHGFRLDIVHKFTPMSIKAREYAMKTICERNPNCLMIVRIPNDDNHILEIRDGLQVGASPKDAYKAKAIESIEAVSIPVWSGKWRYT